MSIARLELCRILILRFYQRKHIRVLTAAGLSVLIASLIIFQYSLKLSAEELISGWIKSESVEIQQGNYLSAVSKTQGLILAGNLVSGIRLQKNDKGGVLDLMEFGSTRKQDQQVALESGKITWHLLGLFEWKASYAFPSDPNLSIHFFIYAPQAVVLFWIYVAFILLLLALSNYLIAQLEKREGIEREVLLKQAIEQLIDDREIPDVLKVKLPNLVAHWNAFKEILNKSKDQEAKAASALAITNISKQVAHDIRSPLSALSMVTSSLRDLPEDKRLLIRNAVNRINDIANDLLQKSKPPISIPSDRSSVLSSKATISLTVEFIPALLDILVSEKRMQYREYSGIEIEIDLKDSFGAFANINGAELKRVISNLVNNAIEAFANNQGKVIVAVRKLPTERQIEIFVQDNGKGIPEQILKKLGEEGITHGKEGTSSGSGIGVFHAKKTVESFGGIFKIASDVGTGTTIQILLPMAEAPKWFAETIDLSGKNKLVSLDDDTSIHQIWGGRLTSLGFSQVEQIKIQSGEIFVSYINSHISELMTTLFLIDFELLNQAKTGLDIIEELALEKYSVLVTSRYEEKAIQERAAKIGLKLLPKALAGFVPFEMKVSKKRYDAVLLDDDDLIHLTWKMAAEECGKTLLCFNTGFELESALRDIDTETTFYIDSNLANKEKGEVVAKNLYSKGFKNLYLATGYEPNHFDHVTWVKGVIGKEPHFDKKKRYT